MDQGYRRGVHSSVGPTVQQNPRHGRMFPPTPQGQSRTVTPSPGSAGVRSLQTGGHCPSRWTRSAQLPAHLGHRVVLDQPSHVRACWGGRLSSGCPGRPSFYTGRSLQCPDGDPGVSPTNRPGWSPGGQSRLWLPQARRAECVSSSASQGDRGSSPGTPSVCPSTHLVFVTT